jgi:N-methylhydantoinase A/oxoprolinase/acetone carboxylase beta subunit
VLVDHASSDVLASAKALTTRHDLSIGIGQAVAAVFDGQGVSPAEVDLVALSTTLATNAIVEGQGSPVCLLLIGYDPALIRQYGFERELVTQDIVYLHGGHDGAGDEVEPLDEAVAREAILARRDQVEAFAVSGYFGVRNPAHELQARALVEELTGLPVTCGHELTTRLNSVRRATTAALNARLIPLLRELIATVHRTLDEQGITAPLMVVKGDGSLVRAEWAMRRPIETILSGPAASVVGAWHLAGQRDVWVVDIGGTTTDIAVLHDGRPRLNPEGAQVGEWRTMVEAVDVHTVGLGGDSQVRLDGQGRLAIGPRRVVPLCLLASEHPQVVDELRRQVRARQREGLAGQFVMVQRPPSGPLSDSEQTLLHHLATGPQSLTFLANTQRYGSLVVRQVESLEARRLVTRAGFTPTDALHVLGRFQLWDATASRLGAEMMAAQVGLSPEAFCEQVASGVSGRVTRELVSKVLGDEATVPNWEREPSAVALLSRALDSVPDSDLACQLTLRQPVVAVGAPVEAYLPGAARQLHTELVIPLDTDRSFRLHLPDGVRDFDSVEESVAYAQRVVPGQLERLARQAGADQLEVRMERVDRNVPVGSGWEEEIYLGTQLTFTAVGRPRTAQSVTI